MTQRPATLNRSRRSPRPGASRRVGSTPVLPSLFGALAGFSLPARSSKRSTDRRARRSRGPNGLPSPRRGAAGKLLIALLVLVVGGAGAAYTLSKAKGARTGERSDLIVESVKRAALEISITERGSLESSANKTLTCLVEGEAGTGILKIVDEGTRVTKDQVVVELDSSRLRDSATQQQIVVEQAEAAMKTSEKNVEIQKTQNESDVEAAKLKLKLAQIDLDKYENGDFIQQLNTILGEIQLAHEDEKRYDEKYKFTQKQIKKGYATQSELEADRLAVKKAQIALAVAKEKEKVLKEYTRVRELAEKKANAAEFERELKRVELKTQAALAQQEADFSAKKLTYQVEKEQYDKLQRQIAVCVIRAPSDGLVVYANTRTGGRGGGNEPLIYEGAKVKERQAIINLPDISNMQVNARIHESKIDLVSEGLPATIRLDALPGEIFHGSVSMVSLVPMSGNWPNFNLKEYITYVRITDESSRLQSLKPGLTAEVEILIDRLNSVLQAPITAFVERGGRQFCWLLSDGQIVRREVKTGKSNEVTTQVIEDESLYGKGQGIKEGDRVVLNPRTVLPKEIALLEEDVPATSESQSAFKPGDMPPPKEAGGKRRGGPGAGTPTGPGSSPGESAGGGRGRGNFDPEAMFAASDTNADGKITEAEAGERWTFLSASDKDKDKAVSKEEFLKGIEEFRQRGAGGGGAGGGPGGGGRGRGGPPGGGGPGAGS